MQRPKTFWGVVPKLSGSWQRKVFSAQNKLGSHVGYSHLMKGSSSMTVGWRLAIEQNCTSPTSASSIAEYWWCLSNVTVTPTSPDVEQARCAIWDECLYILATIQREVRWSELLYGLVWIEWCIPTDSYFHLLIRWVTIMVVRGMVVSGLNWLHQRQHQRSIISNMPSRWSPTMACLPPMSTLLMAVSWDVFTDPSTLILHWSFTDTISSMGYILWDITGRWEIEMQ